MLLSLETLLENHAGIGTYSSNFLLGRATVADLAIPLRSTVRGVMTCSWQGVQLSVRYRPASKSISPGLMRTPQGPCCSVTIGISVRPEEMHRLGLKFNLLRSRSGRAINFAFLRRIEYVMRS